MGKKKGVSKRQVNPRLDEVTYRRLESLAAKTPDATVTSMAARLLTDAINGREEKTSESANNDNAEEVTRVLIHYSERVFEKLEVINRNLHDATYLTLMPKRPAEGDAEHGIDNAEDARRWVEKALKPLPD